MRSPLNYCGAPGQTGAKNNQQNEISGFYRTGLYGLIQSNGYGCGRGISVLMQVNEQLLGLCAEPLGHGINDPTIRLMRDNAFDACDIQITPLEGFLGS